MDVTVLDNRTAGRSFLPASAVSAPAFDTGALSRPRWRLLPPPALFAHVRTAIQVFPLLVSKLPPCCSRSDLSRFAGCRPEEVLILPFLLPFLAGTPGWRHLLRPGGTALLCFPATRDPSGFPVPPKKLDVICHGRRANLFSVPPEKAALDLESGPLATGRSERTGQKRRNEKCS